MIKRNTPNLRVVSWFLTVVMIMPLLATIAEAAVVNFLSPLPGQASSGRYVEVAVSFNTQSDLAVTKLELWIDGKVFSKKNLSKPESRGVCSFQWDTAGYVNGSHFLLVKMFAGSREIASISGVGSVGASNSDVIPPLVKITNIKPGSSVKGVQVIKLTALDNSGQYPLVSLLVDQKLKLLKNTPPYIYDLDTTSYDDGRHEIQTYAFDAEGNKSDVVTLDVVFANGKVSSASIDIPAEVIDSVAIAPKAVVPNSVVSDNNLAARAAESVQFETVSSSRMSVAATAPGKIIQTVPKPFIKAEVSSPKPIIVAETPAPRPVLKAEVSTPRPIIVAAVPKPVIEAEVSSPKSTVVAVVSAPKPVIKAEVFTAKPIVVAAVSVPKSVIKSEVIPPKPVIKVKASRSPVARKVVAAKPVESVKVVAVPANLQVTPAKPRMTEPIVIAKLESVELPNAKMSSAFKNVTVARTPARVRVERPLVMASSTIAAPVVPAYVKPMPMRVIKAIQPKPTSVVAKMPTKAPVIAAPVAKAPVITIQRKEVVNIKPIVSTPIKRELVSKVKISQKLLAQKMMLPEKPLKVMETPTPAPRIVEMQVPKPVRMAMAPKIVRPDFSREMLVKPSKATCDVRSTELPKTGKMKLRDLVKSMNGLVLWDSETRTVTAYVKNMKLELRIGKGLVRVNGKQMKVCLMPYISKGRTIIDVRLYDKACMIAGKKQPVAFAKPLK